MAICFDAIGEKYVTFLASEGTEQGAVCKLSANDTVGGCGENDVFCGVAAEVKNGWQGRRPHRGKRRTKLPRRACGHGGKEDRTVSVREEKKHGL